MDQASLTPGRIKGMLARGTLWSFAGTSGDQFITAISFIVLARVLGPEVMGIAVLATALTDVLMTLVRSGVPESVIRHPEADRRLLSTAVWANIAIGVVVASLVVALASPISRFFGAPLVRDLLLVLALTFPIASYTAVCEGILMRRMAFASVARRVLVGSVSGAIVAIVLVLTGFGVWALVAQRIVVVVVGCIVTAHAARFVPLLTLDRRELAHMLRYSGGVATYSTIYKLQPRLSELLIGIFLPSHAVGLYRVASRLVELLTQLIVQPLVKLTFPTLSQLRNDPAAFRNALLSLNQVAALLVVPLLLFTTYFASDIFRFLLGERWTGAVTVFQILALTNVVGVAFVLYPTAMSVTGAPGRVAIFVLVQSACSLLALAAVAQFGVEAAALSRLAVTLCSVPFLLGVFVRHLAIGYSQFFFRTFPVYLTGAATLGACVTADMIMIALGAERLALLLAIPLTSIAYVIALALFGRRIVQTVLPLVASLVPQGMAARVTAFASFTRLL